MNRLWSLSSQLHFIKSHYRAQILCYKKCDIIKSLLEYVMCMTLNKYVHILSAIVVYDYKNSLTPKFH